MHAQKNNNDDSKLRSFFIQKQYFIHQFFSINTSRVALDKIIFFFLVLFFSMRVFLCMLFFINIYLKIHQARRVSMYIFFSCRISFYILQEYAHIKSNK